jgi:hypothetical protein
MAKRLYRRDQLLHAYKNHCNHVEEFDTSPSDWNERHIGMADKAYDLLNKHFPVKQHGHYPTLEDDRENLVGNYIFDSIRY